MKNYIKNEKINNFCEKGINKNLLANFAKRLMTFYSYLFKKVLGMTTATTSPRAQRS
jgi:hypothetical protein